ncbi:MAG: cobamide remodeling phosphodiesterase CbiR [Desulfobacterales bacterium]
MQQPIIFGGPYPPLPQSARGRYPFRLACPSFVYPDHYLPNVRLLAPFVDEIELLTLDSRYPGSLPGKAEIAELAEVGRDLNIRYNVHLPTDIAPGHSDPAVNRQAVDTLRRVLERVAPLDPTTCTLHLPLSADVRSAASAGSWRERLALCLRAALVDGPPAGRISVETLSYPLQWLTPLLIELGLAVCLDLGHLLLHALDLENTWRAFAGRTTILHLHGVAGGRDHLALDRMPPAGMARVLPLLRRFDGTVSLEVFDYERLAASIAHLAACWRA